MSQADRIAAILNKYKVKATFFLANEKTVHGDYTLDDGWAPYWKARVAEGHKFGSHTWRHGYYRADLPGGKRASTWCRASRRPPIGQRFAGSWIASIRGLNR